MNKFIYWQINNKTHLINISNIINNNLKKNNILINNEKKFHNDIIHYLYNSTNI